MTELLVDVADHVMMITINRPEARNAVNRNVSLGIAAAMDELDSQPDLRAAVIVGAGANFSAGMDLKAFLRGEDPTVGDRGFAGMCTRPTRKPLIAAVEGWALAGGCEIALACDVIVAGRSARFGLPEVRRGLLSTAGGLLRLPRRIPTGAAMLIATTGEPVDAEEAYRLGLVDVLVEAGDALSSARDIALRIADNAPLSIVATKAAITSTFDMSLDEAFRGQLEDATMVAASEDAREGATAFVEKRSAIWTGR